jgi:hypothetical protein
VYIEKHQKVALSIFAVLSALLFLKYEQTIAFRKATSLFLFLVPVLFYKVIRYFSGFGYRESHASDYGSENHAGAYAFFFWMVYIIVCCGVYFDWRLY